MRIEKLHLHAFGPFTDLNLSFPEARADFHIIYGRNEAGKSSLLRALRDLLFGIPSRSGDGFLHEYSKLKLEAEIQNRAGQRLRFFRRKGNSKTIVDERGAPLPEDALNPYLGGVSADYFSAMFGMGSTELREGSAQLLNGQGDLGTALFAASHGGAPVRSVIEQLEKDAGSLFRGRATKDVLIRTASAQLKDLLKRSKEAVVSVEDWEAVQSQLDAAHLKQQTLVKTRAACTTELDWIQRCEDTLPTVGEMRETLKALDALGELPCVTADFGVRAAAALASLEAAAKQPESLDARIRELGRNLSDCRVDELLMEDEPELNFLHEALAGYNINVDSLVNCQARAKAIEARLAEGMRLMKLAPDFSLLERLRIGEAQHNACVAAAKSMEKSGHELSLHLDAIQNLEEDLKINLERLRELPNTDLDFLRDALADAAEATEAANTLATARVHAESMLRTAQAARALVPGAPESLDIDALAALAIPLPGTMRSFQDKFAAADRQIADKRMFVAKQEEEIQSHRNALQALDRFGALPSEETLSQARKFRDRGWEMVLAEWKGASIGSTLMDGIPLEKAFPQLIAKADEIADQLRKDANAVAEAQEQNRQIRACQDRIARALVEIRDSEKSAVEEKEAWEVLWAPLGIKPGTPDQMQEWREGWLSLRDAVTRLGDATRLLAEKERKVAEAHKKLAEALGDSSERSFQVLFNAARRRVQEGEQAQGERKQIQGSINAQQSRLSLLRRKTERIENEAARAGSEWKRHLAELGVAETNSPETTLALLQERRDFLSLFDQWTECTTEAARLNNAIHKYMNRAQLCAQKHGVTALETPVQVGSLWRLFNLSKDASKERERLKKEIFHLETGLEDARLKMQQIEQDVGQLAQEAGLSDVSQLGPLVSRLERQALVKADLCRIRGIIAGLARTEEIEAFVARVSSEAPETFALRKGSLQLQQEDCDRQLAELGGEIHRLNYERETMEKAGDLAAQLKQQAEMQAAILREHAARYIRLQLALGVLRRQVEQFRARNQGPLLEKSGAAFRHMTQGAFTALAADFNEKDAPVLVGCRANGCRVQIEGMSEGTRDQLYLSLRLAALELHLQTHEPMPLVLDDLLMTFDDERAKAVLPELAKMASRTQVFLFTHHEHLIELSKEALGPEGCVVHRLGNS